MRSRLPRTIASTLPLRSGARDRVEFQHICFADPNRNRITAGCDKFFLVGIKVTKNYSWDLRYASPQWANARAEHFSLLVNKSRQRFIRHLEVPHQILLLLDWRCTNKIERASTVDGYPQRDRFTRSDLGRTGLGNDRILSNRTTVIIRPILHWHRLNNDWIDNGQTDNRIRFDHPYTAPKKRIIEGTVTKRTPTTKEITLVQKRKWTSGPS